MNKTKWPEDGKDWPMKDEKQKEEAVEKLLSFEEVCGCVAKGEAVQERVKGYTGWHDLGAVITHINTDVNDYRRKPAEKWEPWTRDTAPKTGAVIHDSDGDEYQVVAKLVDGLYIGGHEDAITYRRLVENPFYNYNGQRCGRRVE